MLNYAEIGKTMADLCADQDTYIQPGAFQPFKHYSADFNVKFFDSIPDVVSDRELAIINYYHSRQEFFGQWQECFVSGSIPLALIDQWVSLNDIQTRQLVTSVKLI
jgi:hypothetical protein